MPLLLLLLIVAADNNNNSSSEEGSGGGAGVGAREMGAGARAVGFGEENPNLGTLGLVKERMGIYLMVWVGLDDLHPKIINGFKPVQTKPVLPVLTDFDRF